MQNFEFSMSNQKHLINLSSNQAEFWIFWWTTNQNFSFYEQPKECLNLISDQPENLNCNEQPKGFEKLKQQPARTLIFFYEQPKQFDKSKQQPIRILNLLSATKSIW